MDKKPMLLVNEDLAEGVYAASGTPAVPDVTYTLRQDNSWDGHKGYFITFTNNTSRTLKTLTVTMKVTGTVTEIGGNGSNVTGVVNGSTATVTFNTWNPLEPNTSVSDIYMHVSGVGDFSLS